MLHPKLNLCLHLPCSPRDNGLPLTWRKPMAAATERRSLRLGLQLSEVSEQRRRTLGIDG